MKYLKSSIILLLPCLLLAQAACSASTKASETPTKQEHALSLKQAEQANEDETGKSVSRESEDNEKFSLGAFVQSKNEALNACYLKEQATKPALAGSITVKWEIKKDGSVANEEVFEDSLYDSKVSDCVLAEVASWRFPEQEKETIIRFPFAFSPETISDEELRNTLYQHKTQIDACYQDELARSPRPREDLEGEVSIAWTIDASGIVLNERVMESTIENKRVENCLLKSIKDMQFRVTKQRREVVYPFKFSQDSGIE